MHVKKSTWAFSHLRKKYTDTGAFGCRQDLFSLACSPVPLTRPLTREILPWSPQLSLSLLPNPHGTHFPHGRGRRLISQATMGSPSSSPPAPMALLVGQRSPISPKSQLSQWRADPSARKEDQRARGKRSCAAGRPALLMTSAIPSPVTTDDSRSDHSFFFLSSYRCLWILSNYRVQVT
jgi:hypothetical protein